MIDPAQEAFQGRDDVFSVQMWDAAGECFVAVKLTDAEDAAAVETLVVKDGAALQSKNAALVTETPLERWRVTVHAGGAPMECQLSALCAPVSTLGGERYTQLCRITGSLDGFGVRSHTWGPAGARQRMRFVSAAVPDGKFVTVVAARPAADVPHGEEVITGHLFHPAESAAPEPFEDVRLSTIYDSEGRPRTAGLELYRPADEFPTRASGEAVWSGHDIGFFRWSLSGSRAWGTYELQTSS